MESWIKIVGLLRVFPGAGIRDRMQVGNSSNTQEHMAQTKEIGKYIRVESFSTMETRQYASVNCVLLYCGAGD